MSILFNNNDIHSKILTVLSQLSSTSSKSRLEGLTLLSNIPLTENTKTEQKQIIQILQSILSTECDIDVLKQTQNHLESTPNGSFLLSFWILKIRTKKSIGTQHSFL